MQVAFKRWRLGEFAGSREFVLPGGERTAEWWERTAVYTQRPGLASQGEGGLSQPGRAEALSVLVLGAGSLWEVSLWPTALPAVAGLISKADCLGTGSRFRSAESSSFQVQLKCHLCKDSPSP